MSLAFQETIHSMLAAKDQAQQAQTLVSRAHALGLQNIIICNDPANFHHLEVMPGWQEYYFAQNLNGADCMYEAIATTRMPHLWSHIDRIIDLTDDNRRFLNVSREAGFRDGISAFSLASGLPLVGTYSARYDDADVVRAFPEIVALHSIYAQHGASLARPALAHLTAKEKEIVTLMCLGLNREAIADRLNRSSDTIRTHGRNIYRKLGISSRLALLAYALQSGLVSTSIIEDLRPHDASENTPSG